MELSRPLNCLIIQHVIDDPDVIEHYLAIDSTTTEKCLPIALRDVLNEYGVPAGLAPMHIPTATRLYSYLANLWNLHETPSMKLNSAVRKNLIYLVPYLLTHGAAIDLLSAYSIERAVIHGNLDIVRLLFLPPRINGQAMWRPAQLDSQVINRLWHIVPERSLPALEIMLEARPDVALIRRDVTQASLNAFRSVRLLPEYMPIIRDRLIQYITTGR